MRRYYGIEFLRLLSSLTVILYHYRHFFSPYSTYSSSDFDDSKINLPIDQTGIDSLGLVAVRIEIEKYIHHEISDEHWYSFNTINDIIEHCDKINTVTSRNKGNSLKQTIKKVMKSTCLKWQITHCQKIGYLKHLEIHIGNYCLIVWGKNHL